MRLGRRWWSSVTVAVLVLLGASPSHGQPTNTLVVGLVAEPVALVGLQTLAGPTGVETRAEQRFVGVDVADARDPALVEQERLDRCDPPT